MSKNTIIKGTLILTAAGLLTRIIGFFYKIFLSNAMGAERMGIYQLIFPVYAICQTIYSSGIQTAISKLVAEAIARDKKRTANKILGIGLLLSSSIALLLSFLLYLNSDYVAYRFLLEPSCASSLRILSLIFPFCGITSCINGYYYGLKKAGIPASTQLLEQIVRVGAVYFLSTGLGGGDQKLSCELAVFGLVAGEIASNLYNIASLLFTGKHDPKSIPSNSDTPAVLKNRNEIDHSSKKLLKQFGALSVPLTTNRLLISVLHSIEAVLIPSMLKQAGLQNSEALSIYGILNGMTMPFIMFPSAITNSLSVLLLPTISEAQAKKNNALISKTVTLTMKYSLILGIFSTGIFFFFGNSLGTAVFHESTAGGYLVILSWLCPFLYSATTLSSIINGIGKTHLTFFSSIAGLLTRIILVVILVPKQGITGYFNSLLISQLLLSALDLIIIKKNIAFSFDAINSILKPGIMIVLGGSFFHRVFLFLQEKTSINELLLLLSTCAVLCVTYLILLFITKTIQKGEWHI